MLKRLLAGLVALIPLATFGVMGLTHWRFPELWRLRRVGHEPAR